MKKWSNLSLLALILAALLLHNCKKKETDPLEPNPGLVTDIENVELAPVTLDEPEPVTTTESSITTSPAVAELATGLAALAAGGPVPESLSSAAADVSGSLEAGEISALASVDASTISTIAAGGELPSELKTIMDKVAADDKLKAYLPSFTLPTVQGQSISARIAADATGRLHEPDDIMVSDECLQKANDAFNAAKTKLDASKASELEKVAAAYNAAIAPLAANQATCTSGLDAKYEALSEAAINTSNSASTALDAGRAALGEELYQVLKALNTIALLGHLSSLNTLKAADANACIAITTAATNAAQAARDANTAKVESAYQSALSEATDLRAQLLESCHNQGGGN